MTSPLERKLKITGPVVVTANRLSDGAVVYRTAAGTWSTRLDEALVVSTVPAATQLLSEALADDVGAVCVEVLPLTRAVQPDLRTGAFHAFVPDVAQQRARCVLAHRRAEVEAEGEVGELHLVRFEEVDGEAS